MASVVVNGDTSGAVTLSAPAVAGTVTVTLPSTSGTMALTSGASAFTDLTVTNGASIQGLTVGRGAGAVSTNTAVGASALAANTTGLQNTSVGRLALTNSTTGSDNSALGNASLISNTTGQYNVALGSQALVSNTTASYNTAVGFQAGYTNVTGTYNTFLGYTAGYRSVATSTAVNTFVGAFAGYEMTTGAKNTIIGAYNGNQGGLDIRTASNYIVLSDGDGTPQIYNNAVTTTFGVGGTGSTYTGTISLRGSNAANRGAYILMTSNGSGGGYVGIRRAIQGGATGAEDFMFVCNDPTYGVFLNGTTATSWSSASDERLKENLVEITGAASKVLTLRAVIGNYKADADKTRKPFLIAQDVQAVLPEAVGSGRNSKEDETQYLSVAYTDVIPLLVAAIKELKAEIDALKGTA